MKKFVFLIALIALALIPVFATSSDIPVALADDYPTCTPNPFTPEMGFMVYAGGAASIDVYPLPSGYTYTATPFQGGWEIEFSPSSPPLPSGTSLTVHVWGGSGGDGWDYVHAR